MVYNEGMVLSFKRDFNRLRQIGARISTHLESVILIMILGLFVLLCLFQELKLFSFQLGNNVSNILGNIVQSLASIFAIVFSISLVAIQLCSENLSHRLIGLYVKNRNFLVPFVLNLTALLFDLFLLSDERYIYLAGYGVLFSIIAVLSLVLFFVFTVRFLKPVHVARGLLGRVKVDNLLSENFAEIRLYRESFQPIEDIVSNCARKGDYATAQGLIELVREKMYDVLNLVNKKMREESEESFARPLVYMSEPFARLLEGIAVSSNKNDAMEITIYVISVIGDFVEHFREARFVPAFKVFDKAIEHIHFQAGHRFSSTEYAADLARLEVAIADARVSFSKLVE